MSDRTIEETSKKLKRILTPQMCKEQGMRNGRT